MIKIRQADENDFRSIRILLKELEESTKSHNDITQIELNKLFYRNWTLNLWEQLVDEVETV